jgi:titin
VIIDGGTQPSQGGDGYFRIVLTGTNAGSGANGLTITAGNCTITDLVINGFSGSGIVLQNGGGNVVSYDLIGTDVTGTLAQGNGHGILIQSSDNLIGRLAGNGLNVISGNTIDGVNIASGTGNILQYNHIGLNIAGNGAVPNATGVVVAGSGNTIGGMPGAVALNRISGNSGDGIHISGSNNVVQNSFIGTDISGYVAIGNYNGISISGTNNLIGGNMGLGGNLIAGNRNDGVLISGSGNQVLNDGIGSTDEPRSLPNYNGVYITGDNNDVGGSWVIHDEDVISGNTNFGVFISGNGNRVRGNSIGIDGYGGVVLPNAYGVYISGGTGNTIGGDFGNIIGGNRIDGIYILGDGNAVEGNTVGRDSSDPAFGNGRNGVTIIGSNNRVGGADPRAHNIVSGNTQYGIYIEGNGNVIQLNYIGATSDGYRAIGNLTGIYIASGSDNLIGGDSFDLGNLISGNSQDGILVASQGNRILANFIGCNASGTAALPNGNGIEITGDSNLIGSSNIISGNSNAGIILSSDYNIVQGCFVGTVNGRTPIANGVGIIVDGSHNTIGGPTLAEGNGISGNTGNGIVIRGDDNLVQGNAIGTDQAGRVYLPNGDSGILILGSNNLIGGTAPLAGNYIAFNGYDGILIDGGTGNTLQQNLIFSHDSGLEIELVNDGNGSQAFPGITSAVYDGGQIVIIGLMISRPNTTFTLEFFASPTTNPSGYGEARLFIGFIVVTTDALGIAVFTAYFAVYVPGQYISATATDSDGNTSSFSLSMQIVDLLAVRRQLGTQALGYARPGTVPLSSPSASATVADSPAISLQGADGPLMSCPQAPASGAQPGTAPTSESHLDRFGFDVMADQLFALPTL